MPNTMNGEPLRDEAHLRLLRLLDENPRMAQRDLAKALGVSVGKTNYCLKALLEKGLVKVGNFRRSDNKLAYAYVLTPAGITAKASLTIQFLARKTFEYERLKHEIEILQADVDAANASKEREAMHESKRLNTPESKMAADAERNKS